MLLFLCQQCIISQGGQNSASNENSQKLPQVTFTLSL